MQGAVASHAYDPTTPTRSLGVQDSGTPNCYAYYWTSGAPCYFASSAGAGDYVNFFNANDWALNSDHWQLNQNFKPDGGYGYNPVPPAFFYQGDETSHLNFPTNTYAIFAYCDEARCYALGAQANVGGAFQRGVTYQQVSLPSVWPVDTHPHSAGSYSAHVWHSAEFRSDNPSRTVFWNTVLGINGFDLK